MLFWKYMSDVWRDPPRRLFEGIRRRRGAGEASPRSRSASSSRTAATSTASTPLRNEADIGERMNVALAGIEEANKAKLEGVFREVDFNSESKLGQTKDREHPAEHAAPGLRLTRGSIMPALRRRGGRCHWERV